MRVLKVWREPDVLRRLGGCRVDLLTHWLAECSMASTNTQSKMAAKVRLKLSVVSKENCNETVDGTNYCSGNNNNSSTQPASFNGLKCLSTPFRRVLCAGVHDRSYISVCP